MKSFNKTKRKVDLAYLTSFILIIFSIFSNLISEYLIRKVILTKANIDNIMVPVDLSILLIIKFFVITFLLLLIFVISKHTLRLYSLKANVFRAIIIVFAGYAWNKAIDLSSVEIPIYMTSLVALSIPIFVTILCKLILGEKITPQRLAIVVISKCTLFLILLKYILSGFYPISIIILIIACILYSFSDTLNIKIMDTDSNKKEEKRLFFEGVKTEFIEKAKKESVAAQIFYTNLFAILFSLIFMIIRTYFDFLDLRLQIASVKNILQTRWIEFFLIGFFSILMTGFSLFGFKVKSGSSVQYIKILEPIIAGVFFSSFSEIPIDILFAIIILFFLSVTNFLMEVQHEDKL